jgi:hypothetical protein
MDITDEQKDDMRKLVNTGYDSGNFQFYKKYIEMLSDEKIRNCGCEAGKAYRTLKKLLDIK